MDSVERRHELVAAACKVAALEYEHIGSKTTPDPLHHARTLLDLQARLYVEAIGPRIVEPPERMYGQTTDGRDAGEEE